MTTQTPCIQIFAGVPEEITSVSLRRDRARGTHIALMRFQILASLEHFLSFRKNSENALHLIDSEGEILIEPSGIKLLYGGPEGDDLKGVECMHEITQEDYWERFMRFMNCYAKVNDLGYEDSASE